jgi:hypothetical protein
MAVSGSNENILQSCSGGGGGGGVCLRLQQLLGQVCGKRGRDETRSNKKTNMVFNKARSANTSHPALPHAAHTVNILDVEERQVPTHCSEKLCSPKLNSGPKATRGSVRHTHHEAQATRCTGACAGRVLRHPGHKRSPATPATRGRRGEARGELVLGKWNQSRM